MGSPYRWPPFPHNSRFNVTYDGEDYTVPEMSAADKRKYEEYISAPERTSHERKFLRRATAKLPKNAVDALLYAMPGNQSMPTYEMHDSTNTYYLHYILAKTAELLGSDVEERCEEDCINAKHAFARYSQSVADARSGLAEITEKRSESLELADQQLKQSKQKTLESLSDVAAKRCLERARVTDEEVHFPRPLSCVSGFLTSLPTPTDAAFSEIVSQKISRLMSDPENFKSSAATNLVFKEKEKPKVQFLHVTVSHIPKARFPDDIFERSFMSYKDQMVKLYKTNEVDARGMLSTHVLLQLGSDKVPPQTLVQGRYRQFLQRELELLRSWPQAAEWTRMYYESCASGEPAARDQMHACYENLRSFEGRLAHLADIIREYSSRPPFSPMLNPDRMKVEVVYPHRHCALCHSSSHRIRECDDRACVFCASMTHLSSQCKLKCACKIGPLHSLAECPRTRARVGRS